MPQTVHHHFQNNLPLKIIIVDDAPRVRQDLRHLLQLTGEIEVVGEARNGVEAIKQVERLQPEAVVMDIVMPVMDGLRTTRRLKESFPEIRIIILTMYENFRLDAYEAMADAFLVKGCPVNALISAIAGR